MTDGSIGSDVPLKAPNDLTRAAAVLGFACLLAMLMSVLFVGGLHGSDFSLRDSATALSFCWIGLLLTQSVSYTPYVEQRLPTNMVTRALLFILPFVVALAVLVYEVVAPGILPFALSCATRFIIGALVGLLLPIWGSIWSSLDSEHADTRQTAHFIALSVLVVAVLCVFNAFAPPLVACAAILAFYGANIALIIWCTRAVLQDETLDVSLSKKHLSILSRNLLPPVVLMAILGALLCYWNGVLGSAPFYLVLLAGMALAALAMVTLLVLLGRVPLFSTIERWVIGVCAVALTVSALSSSSLALVAGMVAVVALVLYLIGHWSVLVALSYHHRVLTLYHYAQGLIAPLGGLLIGWLIVVGIDQFAPDREAAFVNLQLLFLLALVLVFCIVPFTSNTLVEELFIEDSTHDAMNDHMTQASFFQRKTHAIARAARLSPREIEVFALLAKGRNAEHIAKTLFISTHTVKTHVYRIYRKLDVNTQQELIDKVDSLRV
ncbi:MAG: helix-turn-helix transcriptional regulator [Coriobacteriales bacterium]|jgi:DNA-binding CsgD family transcriptional regulator|nr:helix-turn-helix transcriptional regulator [Coriobacteriales bacterium]